MANLIHMVETVSVPSSFCKPMNEVPDSLKESYNRSVGNRITESTKANKDDLLEKLKVLQERSLNESDRAVLEKVVTKLSESGITNGPKIWKFPVARINDKQHPNGNGRIYTRELWENVINNQRDAWCRSVGLSDHPKDDSDPGEFKQSSIVWLDMMIDDAQKLIWALGSFVGQYGKLAQEIIEAGGRIGFSSSGFGELESDGMTVNPDTYQIERTADIVLNPSQSVYGDISDDQSKNIEYTPQSSKVTESVVDIPNGNRVQESKSQIIKEKEMKSDAINESSSGLTDTEAARQKILNVLSEAEVKEFKKYVNQFLEDANGIKNPIDRLHELSDIMDMVESGQIPDLQEKVQEKLIAERNRLNEMVNQAVSVTDEFGLDIGTFKENAKKVATQAIELKTQNEALNNKIAKAKDTFVDVATKLQAHADELKEKTSILSEQTNDYEALCTALTERNKELAAALEEAKKTSNELTVSNLALADKFDETTKRVGLLKTHAKTLEEEGTRAIKDATEEKMTLINENKSLKAENSKLSFKLSIKEHRDNKELIERKRHEAELATRVQELTERVKTLAGNNLKSKELNEKLAKAAAEAEKVASLRETVSELEKSNKDFENKFGVLQTKYKVLIGKYNNVNSLYESEKIKNAKNEMKIKENATAAAKPETKIEEKVEQKPVEKAEDNDSLKGYLNFREGYGVEIEKYWLDLYSKYGESIKPFMDKIRGAKTLTEATNNFYKYLSDIDSNAHRAQEALVSDAVTSGARRKILEDAGYEEEVPSTEDDENSHFKELLKKEGLQ